MYFWSECNEHTYVKCTILGEPKVALVFFALKLLLGQGSYVGLCMLKMILSVSWVQPWLDNMKSNFIQFFALTFSIIFTQ